LIRFKDVAKILLVGTDKKRLLKPVESALFQEAVAPCWVYTSSRSTKILTKKRLTEKIKLCPSSVDCTCHQKAEEDDRLVQAL
jgi:hypothetical protein